jgi:hypothetical protein
MSEIFREKPAEPTELVKIESPETPNVVEGVDGTPTDEPTLEERASQLDDWELTNGKYGAEYFGIKEIVKEFPLRAHFGAVDEYIKSEIKARSWEKNTENYQKILNEMENEIGSRSLDTYTRLKKLFDYVNIAKKIDELKRKKEMFRA